MKQLATILMISGQLSCHKPANLPILSQSPLPETGLITHAEPHATTVATSAAEPAQQNSVVNFNAANLNAAVKKHWTDEEQFLATFIESLYGMPDLPQTAATAQAPEDGTLPIPTSERMTLKRAISSDDSDNETLNAKKRRLSSKNKH